MASEEDRSIFVEPLPVRPTLELQQKRAKELLRAVWAGDAETLARIRTLHPKPPAPDALKLADAQLVVARGYGFESWAAMKRKIESLTTTPVERFLIALHEGDAERVRQLLEAHADVPSTREMWITSLRLRSTWSATRLTSCDGLSSAAHGSTSSSRSDFATRRSCSVACARTRRRWITARGMASTRSPTTAHGRRRERRSASRLASGLGGQPHERPDATDCGQGPRERHACCEVDARPGVRSARAWRRPVGGDPLGGVSRQRRNGKTASAAPSTNRGARPNLPRHAVGPGPLRLAARVEAEHGRFRDDCPAAPGRRRTPRSGRPADRPR